MKNLDLPFLWNCLGVGALAALVPAILLALWYSSKKSRLTRELIRQQGQEGNLQTPLPPLATDVDGSNPAWYNTTRMRVIVFVFVMFVFVDSATFLLLLGPPQIACILAGCIAFLVVAAMAFLVLEKLHLKVRDLQRRLKA